MWVSQAIITDHNKYRKDYTKDKLNLSANIVFSNILPSPSRRGLKKHSVCVMAETSAYCFLILLHESFLCHFILVGLSREIKMSELPD